MTVYGCFRHLVVRGNTAKSPNGPIDTKILTTNLIALTIKAITNAYTERKCKHARTRWLTLTLRAYTRNTSAESNKNM